MNPDLSNKNEATPPQTLRLAFAPESEQQFRADYALANLNRLRIGLLVAIGLYVLFLLLRLNQESGAAALAGAAIRLGIIASLGLTWFLSYRLAPVRLTPVVMACYLAFGLGVTAIEVTSNYFGIDRHYEGLLLISFHCFVFSGLLFHQACWIAGAILMTYALGGWLGGLAGKAWSYQLLFMFLTDVIGAIALYMIESRTRGEYLARQLLAEEREKSERLLLSILPEPVARQLKNGQTHIAENFEQVSVVMADIVGFTRLAASLSPRQVVELLNRLFTEFDQLADQLGLEKIKTIGDAYMAVAGLPLPRSDHADVAARLALAMRAAAGEIRTPHGEPLNLHIGLHCGPVVAGVIGARKFSYDLWGDTINIVTRLQTQAQSGRIIVSENVWMRLTDRYRFSEPQTLDLKGCGSARTFELLGSLEPGILH